LTFVVEVRFKGNRKGYFSWPADDPTSLHLDDPVIVEVERGQDCGRVTAVGNLAAKKCERCGDCALSPHPEGVRPRVVRRATAGDLRTKPSCAAPRTTSAARCATGCGTTPSP